MNRLEKQFLGMAGLSAASLAAFFGYFFSPRAPARPLPPPAVSSAEGIRAGFIPMNARAGIAFSHQRMTALPDIGHITGSGVCVADLDGDGLVDIYLLNSTPMNGGPRRPCMLYLNRGGGTFEAVAGAQGADPDGLNMGVACADYDQDGDLDLYVSRVGPDRLFRNDGTGQFEDVTSEAGIVNERWGTSLAWEDFDRDGHLDIFVANYVTFDPDNLPEEPTSTLDRDEEAAFNPYLFASEPDLLLRSNGDGTFTDVSEEAGIIDPAGKGLGATFTDLNDDGWPDIYVVNDVSANLLYVNQRDGRFAEMAGMAGVADPRGGMGLAVGDFDNDLDIDLFSTHWQDELNVLYRNLGLSGTGLNLAEVGEGPGLMPRVADLFFEDVTVAVGLARTSLGLTGWGTEFFDADQDGDLDLYITNGYTSPSMGDTSQCVPQADRILINTDGRYVDRSAELLADVPAGAGRGVVAADLDGDGDLDIVRTNNNGPVVVLENRLARGHWLMVEPAGSVVVGCDVRVSVGRATQRRIVRAGRSFLSCGPPVAHFGLGTEERVDRLEVRWPDGTERVWRDVAVDQRFVARADG